MYHLDRLQRTLDALDERLRATVIQAVGQTVAEVTCDLLQAMLTDSSTPADPLPRSQPLVRRSPSFWHGNEDYDEWEEPSWFDDPDELPARSPATKPASTQLKRFFVVSCQIAGWWLKQQTNEFPLLAAVGVGLASAVVAYLAGLLTLAGAGIASSALSLLTLQQLVEAVALLARSSSS